LNCQLFRLGESKDGGKAKEVLTEWINWAAKASGSNKGYFGNVEPKNSFILSLVFLCPTGVFYNLQKARQIDCRYVYCLEQTADGMPLSLCVEQRGVAMCKYVTGQIFNLIPFAAAFSDIAKLIGKALANPWVLGEILARISCRYLVCANPLIPGCSLCSIAEFASWLLETLCDLGIGKGQCTPFWEELDPFQSNYCKKIGLSA
ncbi:unnamed protein product, partial [marine sediment metagenome]